MSNLIKHAERELELAGLMSKDSDYNGMLGTAALELIKVFSEQGHSGCSAGMTIGLFSKLADFKPLCPLTLADDEWNEVGESIYQNKRNSAVFKDGLRGDAYYIDAYTKKTQTGSCWSGSIQLADGRTMGRCYIKDTANMPKIVLNVIEREVGKDDWEMTLEDEGQLAKLAEYYDFTFTESAT